ncbi:MAG: hypothetical protein QOI55_863, partial [Actinomycetota bacterium]|nr:hypothetical protein [Actinomycetota bacterium]
AVLLVVAIEYPVGMFEAVWARYLLDRGASDLFVGLSVATFGVPFIVLATRGGALADRLGPARASAGASLVVAPVIASYGFAHRPGVIAALAAVEACLQAVAIPAARAAIVVASPPDRVIAGQAVAGAAGLFATATAALVAPVVYDASGPRVMCGSVAAVVVVSVLMSLAVTRGSQSTHGPATRRPYGDGQWRGAGTTKHGRS